MCVRAQHLSLFYPHNRENSDVGDLLKAYIDPYELGNKLVSWITGEPRYCWTPMSHFLRAAADHIWAKYQHHEKTFDVYIKEIIRALLYYYDVIALLDELDNIEMLIKKVAENCKIKADIYHLMEPDMFSLLSVTEETLNDIKSEEEITEDAEVILSEVIGDLKITICHPRIKGNYHCNVQFIFTILVPKLYAVFINYHF